MVIVNAKPFFSVYNIWFFRYPFSYFTKQFLSEERFNQLQYLEIVHDAIWCQRAFFTKTKTFPAFIFKITIVKLQIWAFS